MCFTRGTVALLDLAVEFMKLGQDRATTIAVPDIPASQDDRASRCSKSKFFDYKLRDLHQVAADIPISISVPTRRNDVRFMNTLKFNLLFVELALLYVGTNGINISTFQCYYIEFIREQV